MKGNVKNVEPFEQKSKIDIVAIAEFVLKIHHCPWVSKCIGKKNIHFFNFFVGNYIKTCRIYPNIYNVLSNSALFMPQAKLIIFSTSHIIYDRR